MTRSEAFFDEFFKNLEEVVILQGDPTTYEIKVYGKIIRLTSDKMLNASAFRIAWLDNFHELITFNYNEWAYFIRQLLSDKTKIKVLEKEEITTLKLAAEKIIREINNSVVVSKIEDALERGKVWYNGNGEVLVSNDIIQHILENNKGMVTLNQLRVELKEYLAGRSEPRKVRNDSYRFWRFRADKLSLDTQNPLELDEETLIENTEEKQNESN